MKKKTGFEKYLNRKFKKNPELKKKVKEEGEKLEKEYEKENIKIIKKRYYTNFERFKESTQSK